MVFRKSKAFSCNRCWAVQGQGRYLQQVLNGRSTEPRRGCDRRAKRRRRRPARQARPRGATPRPRSGAEAGRTPCLKGGGQEELPHVRGQGQRPRVGDCNSAGTAERSYAVSEVRGGGSEELPHAPPPEARGGGWEPTPHPRSRGCAGAGGPRGAIPR